MKIETLKTSELVPYARNAKKHSEQKVSQIAGSIREFGFNNPVLVDGETPPGIIAGHGRVLAAQKLGMDKVPCIRLGHLSEAQKRAYVLADNRLAETGGGWDAELLRMELEDLAKSMDIELLGFDELVEETETKITKLEIKPPPQLAWVLIKCPLDQFGKVQAALDKMPECTETFTTFTDEDR